MAIHASTQIYFQFNWKKPAVVWVNGLSMAVIWREISAKLLWLDVVSSSYLFIECHLNSIQVDPATSAFMAVPNIEKGSFNSEKSLLWDFFRLEQASCVCILHLRRMIVWCCFLPSLWYYVKIRYLLGAKEKWDILALKDVKSRFTLLLLKHFVRCILH